MTTFASPGGSREVHGLQSKWPPAGRADCGREGAGLAAPTAPAAWTPPRALVPRTLPSRRPGRLFGRRGGGGHGPGPHQRRERGWRPCWGPARAGRGRAAGRRVSVRAAGSAARSRRRRTRCLRGRGCSLPGATVTQHSCQVGPRPDGSHYPKFACGVSSEATWVVTAVLSSAKPTSQPETQFSYRGPSLGVGGGWGRTGGPVRQ